METPDTATLYLFKIWPAIEANKKRIIGGAVAVGLIVVAILLYSWQQGQKEITAGQDFTKLLVSLPPGAGSAELSTEYLKMAADHPGTEAGQRAQLQAAADLFTAGNYAEAQTQFQKFTDAYPESSMIAIAALGLASSLEAQGKTDAAFDAYKKLVDNYNDFPSQIAAKFAIGRIYEEKGKIPEAIRSYDEVSRSVSGSTLGQQAMLKLVELKATLPPPQAALGSAQPTPAPAPAPVSTPAKPAPVKPPSK